jgi:hypothetical protein
VNTGGAGRLTYIIRDEKESELNKYSYDGILQAAKMRHTLKVLELNQIVGEHK